MKTKIPSAEEGEASEIRVPSPILLSTWIELLYAWTIRFCGRSDDHDFVLPVFKNKFPFVGSSLFMRRVAQKSLRRVP